MIAKLWAEQVINNKKTFEQVPAKLKEQVKEILIARGMGNLAI